MDPSTSAPLLVLIDGHGIIYRAYHAMREPLTVRRTGELVAAPYGLANTLLSVIQELKPTHILVALDKGKATFRHQWAPSYKAQRAEMPDDLRCQMSRCRDLIEAFGIPIYEHEGYEADDILGTLSVQAAEIGVDSCLVSLDSDIAQLVRPHVRLWMYRPQERSAVMYNTEEEIHGRYSVFPSQIADLKALKGDSSDNIAGVAGVGDKTAVRLIQQFSSVEQLYDRLEEVTQPKLREALRNAQRQVRQSKALATIALDVPLQLDLSVSEFHTHYNRQQALELFRELEFRSLEPRLPPEVDQQAEPAVPNAVAQEIRESYQLVSSEEDLADLAARADSAGGYSFRILTTDASPLNSHPVGIAIALEPGNAYYLPIGHRTSEPQVGLPETLARLGPLFESRKIQKTAHDGKHEMLALAQQDICTQGFSFDTMIAAMLLSEGGQGNYRPGEGALSLRWLSSRWLAMELPEFPEFTRTGRGQLAISEVAVDTARRYACASADMASRLRPVLEEELRQKKMWSLFLEVEMPLVSTLVRMEKNGVAMDVPVLRELSQKISSEIQRTEEEIYRSIGHTFNIGSPQQLSHVLFQELNLPKGRKTKLGYSTDARALDRLRGLHPAVELTLEYRELTKLKSTYLDPLPSLIDPETNRIHTDFNQAGALTGRISSSNPNLQNIPVRTELGGQVRRAFIARDVGRDPVLFSADYSQIELRIIAHITEDRALIDAFAHDQDIHAVTAALVFDVPLDQVSPEMRRRAKVFNFGVLYGLSEYGLSTREKIPFDEASQFIKGYFERYPGIRIYMDNTVESTRERGYAETLLGRRRYLPEINSANANVRQAAERAAINMPIQGTAADIIKISMAKMDAELRHRKLKSLLILQVHDELILECPQEELQEIRSIAKTIMPNSMKLKVPLKVDTKVGQNWLETA